MTNPSVLATFFFTASQQLLRCAEERLAAQRAVLSHDFHPHDQVEALRRYYDARTEARSAVATAMDRSVTERRKGAYGPVGLAEMSAFSVLMGMDCDTVEDLHSAAATCDVIATSLNAAAPSPSHLLKDALVKASEALHCYHHARTKVRSVGQDERTKARQEFASLRAKATYSLTTMVAYARMAQRLDVENKVSDFLALWGLGAEDLTDVCLADKTCQNAWVELAGEDPGEDQGAKEQRNLRAGIDAAYEAERANLDFLPDEPGEAEGGYRGIFGDPKVVAKMQQVRTLKGGEDIFAEIQQERARQDQKWGGPSHDDEHLPADWGRFIVEHLGIALGLDTDVGGNQWRLTARVGRVGREAPYRDQMVRVAALAVAAIESFDRRQADASMLAAKKATTTTPRDMTVSMAAASELLRQAEEQRDTLRAKFDAYGVGDRPMSPPVRLMRELEQAERDVAFWRENVAQQPPQKSEA